MKRIKRNPEKYTPLDVYAEFSRDRGYKLHVQDDFNVFINDVDTKIFGSQGQQRTSILTMKFSSLKIIKQLTGEYPVLLLDDVLSELDTNRKKYILSSITDIQTIITCTGIDDLGNYLDYKSKIFTVSNGEILN